MRSSHVPAVASLALVALLATAGCGLKGPLALPEKSERVIIRGPGETAVPATSPAAGEAATGEAATGDGATRSPTVEAPAEKKAPQEERLGGRERAGLEVVHVDPAAPLPRRDERAHETARALEAHEARDRAVEDRVRQERVRAQERRVPPGLHALRGTSTTRFNNHHATTALGCGERFHNQVCTTLVVRSRLSSAWRSPR